jgi:CheY-like chemotaxis protein
VTGVDAGTKFTVTLPLVEPPRPVAEPRRARVPAPTAKTVLLVEDEEAVRRIARRILERAGYRVLVARHGAEALSVLADAGPTVDVLLSDVAMPEMGGLELAALAVARTPGLRVLLMSGFSEARVGTMGPDRLVSGFIAKPFTAEALLDAVQAAAGDG